jgi:phosphoserine aminotransferase
LSLRHLKKLGGIAAMEKINEEKAQLLYHEIERNSLFVATANTEDRSNMNVCFLLKDETNQEKFDQMWKAANISGINGHRSVGGYRASIYNAMPIESVQVLVEVMQELEKN